MKSLKESEDMVLFLSVIGGLIFSIIVYLTIFISLIKKNKLELLEWFLLSIATFNGVGFGFVMWATYQGRNPFEKSYFLLRYDSNTVINYLLSNIVLVLACVFGWYITKKVIKKRQVKKLSTNQINFLQGRYHIVAILTLLISMASYFVYTLPYGGFINYLSYGKAIRAGIHDVSNPFSFLKPFGGLAFFSSIILFGMLIETKNVIKNKRRIFLEFIVAVAFSIYVLYSWEGKFALITYTLTFVLGYILYSNKSPLVFFMRMFIFVMGTLIVVIASDFLLGGAGVKVGAIELFAEELSFPYASYIAQVNTDVFRWFQDIATAPLFVFPERIWAGIFHIEAASSVNTYLVSGARKGEGGLTGEIPIDTITFGNMQASIMGVFIIGFIWGILLLIIERRLKNIPFKGLYTIFYANIAINVPIRSVLYGDPQHIINRNFQLILGFIILWLFLKRYSEKRRRI